MAQSISFSNWNIQGIFLLINFTFVTWKWENKSSPIELETRSEFVLFTNRDLVTRKQNNKSLTFKLVTWGENKCFSTCFSTSSNSKVKQKGSAIELVTRSNFFFIFRLRVSNLKVKKKSQIFQLVTLKFFLRRISIKDF